jgi:hypothetical protein
MLVGTRSNRVPTISGTYYDVCQFMVGYSLHDNQKIFKVVVVL